MEVCFIFLWIRYLTKLQIKWF